MDPPARRHGALQLGDRLQRRRIVSCLVLTVRQPEQRFVAARLLRAIEWSTETEDAVDKATDELSTAFEEETAIAAISEALEARWSDLHDDQVDT